MSLIYANIIKRASTGLSTLLSGLKIRQWGLFRNTSKDYSTTELGACNGGGMYAKDDLGQVHEFLEASDTRAVIDAKIALALIGLSSSTEYKGAWSSLLAYALNDKVSFVDTEDYQYIYTANSAMASGGESPDVNTAWDLVIASGVPKAVFDVLALVVDGNTTSIASILETLAQFERATGTYTYNAVALSTGQVRMSLTIVTQSTNTDIFDIDATTGTLNINTISNYLNIATLDFTKSTGTDVVATFRIFNQNDVQLGSDYPMTLTGRTDLQRVIHIPIDDRPIGSYYATIQLSDDVPCTLDATSLVSIVAFNASGSSVYLPKTATVNDVEYNETTKNFPVDTLSVNDRLKLDAVPLELDQELEDIVNEVNTKRDEDTSAVDQVTSIADTHQFALWSTSSNKIWVATFTVFKSTLLSYFTGVFAKVSEVVTTINTHGYFVNETFLLMGILNDDNDSVQFEAWGHRTTDPTRNDWLSGSIGLDGTTLHPSIVRSGSNSVCVDLVVSQNGSDFYVYIKALAGIRLYASNMVYGVGSKGWLSEASTVSGTQVFSDWSSVSNATLATGKVKQSALKSVSVLGTDSSGLEEAHTSITVASLSSDYVYAKRIQGVSWTPVDPIADTTHWYKIYEVTVGTYNKYQGTLQIDKVTGTSTSNICSGVVRFSVNRQGSDIVVTANKTKESNITLCYVVTNSTNTFALYFKKEDAYSQVGLRLTATGDVNLLNVQNTTALAGQPSNSVIVYDKNSHFSDLDKIAVDWSQSGATLCSYFDALFGVDWETERTNEVLHCSINVTTSSYNPNNTVSSYTVRLTFYNSLGYWRAEAIDNGVFAVCVFGASSVSNTSPWTNFQDADCTNYGAQTATRYLVFPCNNAYNSTHENGYLSMNSLASYLSENGDNGLIYTTAVAIMSNLSVSANSLYAEFYRDGTVKFKGALLLNDTYPSSSSYITFVVPSGIVASLDTSLWFPTTIHMSVTTGRNTGYGYFYMFSATALRFKFSNSAEFSTANYWRMGFNTTQINFGHGAFDESVL